jgi:hypothetical protein
MPHRGMLARGSSPARLNPYKPPAGIAGSRRQESAASGASLAAGAASRPRPGAKESAMKSRPSALIYANPFLLWSSLGVKALQMSTAAAQVIAIRTTRMAAHGLNPNAADRREMTRMGAEKVDAFSRAGQALATGALPLAAGMAQQAWRTGFDLLAASTQLAASRTIPQTMARQRQLADTLMRSASAAQPGVASKAAARLAHRALAPVHGKATANARRLTKKAR